MSSEFLKFSQKLPALEQLSQDQRSKSLKQYTFKNSISPLINKTSNISLSSALNASGKLEEYIDSYKNLHDTSNKDILSRKHINTIKTGSIAAPMTDLCPIPLYPFVKTINYENIPNEYVDDIPSFLILSWGSIKILGAEGRGDKQKQFIEIPTSENKSLSKQDNKQTELLYTVSDDQAQYNSSNSTINLTKDRRGYKHRYPFIN